MKRRHQVTNDISFAEMYDSINERDFGIHLGKNPAGTYSFSGSIPVKLGALNKDGSELSDEQADEVAKASNPGMISRVRVFKMAKDAFKAAEKLGIKKSQIKFKESAEEPNRKALMERGPADVKFKTDKVKGHTHLGTTDENGNGRTIKTTGSGKPHEHKITDNEVQPSGGHIHAIISMNEAKATKEDNKTLNTALNALHNANKSIGKVKGQTTSKEVGMWLDDCTRTINALIIEGDEALARGKKGILESSTDNAKGTLQAIIGTLKKFGGDAKSKDMLKMANGIMDHFKKEGSFSPDQAKWIWNTSKALFKESAPLMEAAKKIVLSAAIVGTMNGKDLPKPYRAVIFQRKGKWTLGIEQSFDGKFNKYSMTSGQWRLTDLLDHGDFIYIDMGQQWGARGIPGAVKEALKHI